MSGSSIEVSLVHGNGAVLDSRLQRFAFDQLHNDATLLTGLFKAVNVRDVRMIQRGEYLRLSPETCKPFDIGRECDRKKFDRDAAAPLRIDGLIHFTHSACSQMAGDFVM